MRRCTLKHLCFSLMLCSFAQTSAGAEKVNPTAILPFQERGNEVKGLGVQVSDLLFANLVVKESMFLVDREDLSKVLKEQEMNLSGVVKPEEATKVGQLTGAKVLVTGSVLQSDGKLYLVAKIIGTETTRVLGASVSGNLRESLDNLAKQLAADVAKTIDDRAADLLAKPKTRDDRLAAIKKTLGNAKRPSVAVDLAERHENGDVVRIGGPTVVIETSPPAAIIIGSSRPGVRRAPLDPAAETEIMLYCKELGFEVIEPKVGNKQEADVLLTGEGFSEFASRQGGLISVKARLEMKAVDRKSGRVLAVDRQTAVVVDLTEQIAGKSALQEAAAEILERLLPKIVQTSTDKPK
jgi:TolB-like protein